MPKKILISEFMDAPAVASLQARFDVDYRPKLVDDAAALAAALPSADAWIVRNRTQVRGELLGAASRVRVVGRLGVGLDNIDVPACEARGIQVIPATGANAESVAEYVVTAALVLLRGAYFSTRAVEAGTWPRQTLSQGREASGKVMGIVGFGSIGRLTARKALAIGMKAVGFDAMIPAADAAWKEAGVAPRSLEQLLAESDVVAEVERFLGKENGARA